MKLVLIALGTLLSISLTGQCDSLLLTFEVNRIERYSSIDENKHLQLSNLIDTLLEIQCYEQAILLQFKKIEIVKPSNSIHIEYDYLTELDSIMGVYKKNENNELLDSFIIENFIAWADFFERTGYHSNTIEKFKQFETYLYQDNSIPDELIESLLFAFRNSGGKYMAKSEYAIAIDYLKRGLLLTEYLQSKKTNTSKNSLLHGDIADCYLLMNDLNSAKPVIYQHLNFAQQLVQFEPGYEPHLKKAYRNLVRFYLLSNELDSAEYYCEKFEKLELLTTDDNAVSASFWVRIFIVKDEITEAQKLLIRHYNIRKQKNSNPESVNLTDNLAFAKLLIDGKLIPEALELLAFVENFLEENRHKENVIQFRSFPYEKYYVDYLLVRLLLPQSMNKDDIWTQVYKAYKIIDTNITESNSISAKLDFANKSNDLTDLYMGILEGDEDINSDHVFQAMGWSKAATSFKSWKKNQLISNQGSDDLFLKEFVIESSIHQLDKNLQKLKNPNSNDFGNVDKIEAAENDLLLKQLELDSIKRILERENPYYYQMKYDWSLPNISEVQAILEEDEVFLDFYESKESLFALIIGSDYSEYVNIDSVSLIINLITEFNENIFNQYISSNFHYQNSNKLYQKIIAPLKPFLKKRLIISSNGTLFQLPFSALDSAPSIDSVRCLIRDHAISYMPSASFFYQMRTMQNDNAIYNALLVAPLFEDEEPPDNLIASSRSALYPLEFNVSEVQDISVHMNSKLLVNRDAFKSRAVIAMINADLIHLATHAKSNMDAPEKSYIAFYRENGGVREAEYKLYLDDISKLSLNAKMVVLSACQTNLGQVFKGEGAMSLANSYFYAGAQSVVSSLWDAEDKSTSELMSNFYFNLKQGMPKDIAFQKAQVQHLDEYEGFHKNPLYWAGFSLIGNTDSLNFKKSIDYTTLTLVLLSILLVIVLIKSLMKYVSRNATSE